jgi:hypothetical protein
MGKWTRLTVIAVLLFWNFGWFASGVQAANATTFSGVMKDHTFYRPMMPGDRHDVHFSPEARALFSTIWTPDMTCDNLCDEGVFTEGEEEFYYVIMQIIPAATGPYTIETFQTEFDTAMFVYEDSFIEDSPLTNLIAGNDDIDDENWMSRITLNLESGRSYYLVVTSYDEVNEGDTVFFRIDYANGPTEVFIIDPDGTDSAISPETADFDKTPSEQEDIPVTLTLNENDFIGIFNDDTELEPGVDYTVSGNTVTILKSYLAELAAGTHQLTFVFSGDAP